MMGHDNRNKKDLWPLLKTTQFILKGVEKIPLKISLNETISFGQIGTAHSFLLIKDRWIFHSKSTCGHAVYTIKFEGGASIITIM